MSRRVLIVGAGGARARLDRAAQAIGVETVTLPLEHDTQSEADCAEHPVATTAEDIARFAADVGADGICAADERAVAAAAVAAAQLSLPGPAFDTAARLVNVPGMRDALTGCGVSVPLFRVADSLEQAELAARDLPLPFVVRPASGRRDSAVRLLRHIEDLPLAFARARRCSGNGVVLLEEAVEGREYEVLAVIHKGDLAFSITGRIEERADRCLLATGMSMPAAVDDAGREVLVERAAQALAAVGYDNGPARVRLVLTSEGPVVRDVGHLCSTHCAVLDMARFCCGADLIADAIRVAFGEPPHETTTAECSAAAFWIPAHSGTVEEIHGLHSAARLPGVLDLAIHVKPGDELGHVIDRESRDRIGWVIAAGKDAGEAIATARRARGLVEIRTSPIRR